MNTSWKIARQISFGSKDTFSQFIVKIAIVSNALSVCIMVMAICMLSGFTKEIKEKVFGFWGHIQIKHFQLNSSYEETPIIEDAKLLESIQSVKGIDHVAPYIQKAGIVKTKTAMEGLVLKGVNERYDWGFLKKYVKEGELPVIAQDSTSRDMLLSAESAKRLGVGVDDALIIYFLPTEGGSPIGRKFRVSGLYHTGLEEYDLRFALGDLKVLQDLNQWNVNQYSGYEAKVNDIKHLEDITQEVYELLPPELNAESLRTAQPNIFDWLELLVKNGVFALVLMLVVAILNMTTSLMILILDRTKMIGILKALGAENAQIRKIFLFNAMIILGYGLFFGNLIAIVLLWIQKTFGIIKLDESAYYFQQVPVMWDIWSIVAVNLTSIVVTLAVLIIPTMLISKISPLKAIRYD